MRLKKTESTVKSDIEKLRDSLNDNLASMNLSDKDTQRFWEPF